MLRYARFHLGDVRLPTQAEHNYSSLIRCCDADSPFLPPIANSWRLLVPAPMSTSCGFMRHGGATNGQMASLQLVPTRGFAIIMLANSDRGGELIRPVVRKAFEIFLGVVERDPEPLRQ